VTQHSAPRGVPPPPIPTMNRIALALLIILVVSPAHAQQPARMARVVILSDRSFVGPLSPALLDAFTTGLGNLGWTEGRNLAVDVQEIEKPEDRPRVVTELLRLKPDVIVATAPAAYLVAPKVRDPKPKGWTPVSNVPVVFAGVSDPVAAGIVDSLARPGGNITGLSYLGLELNAKRLALLKEAFPNLTRVGVLVPAVHTLKARMIKDVETAARSLKVEPRFAEVHAADSPVKIDEAIESLARDGVGALLGLQGPHFFKERRRVADQALKLRLPGIFELAEYAEAGALIAYGPDLPDIYRRAAGYVDKILRGVRPAELPVEQPTKLSLVVNGRTATALGITFPPAFRLQVERVIE
jgi:ABC-type uncharacterized transport system substrate-binding protein